MLLYLEVVIPFIQMYIHSVSNLLQYKGDWENSLNAYSWIIPINLQTWWNISHLNKNSPSVTILLQSPTTVTCSTKSKSSQKKVYSDWLYFLFTSSPIESLYLGFHFNDSSESWTTRLATISIFPNPMSVY